MTYRWAVVLLLAMLSSSASPTKAWAQAVRASPSDDDPQPGGSASPALRFAAAAKATQVDLSEPRQRPAKRSVLEPSTSRWLEDEDQDPADEGPSGDELAPPDFMSPASGPAPEKIADDFALPPAPHAALTDGAFSDAFGGPPLEALPRRAIRKQPMLRESWLFRPFNVSVFEGALFATPPIAPQFNTATSFFTGFRVGWDYAAHFGGETRFGFSKAFFLDAARTTEVGYQQLFYFDSNLLIYPWGDTRWRPFLSIGGGLADVLIVGNNGLLLHPMAFNMPLGTGIKYRFGPRVAFRADFRDNLTFSGAGGLRTLNNIEVVGGIEFHFGGGDRRSYWPWNPSHHWW